MIYPFYFFEGGKAKDVLNMEKMDEFGFILNNSLDTLATDSANSTSVYATAAMFAHTRPRLESIGIVDQMLNPSQRPGVIMGRGSQWFTIPSFERASFIRGHRCIIIKGAREAPCVVGWYIRSGPCGSPLQHPGQIPG
jgi:hypothetical protein